MSSQVAVIIYDLYQLYPKKLENIVCIYIYILLHNASIDDIGIMNESIVDLKKLKL